MIPKAFLVCGISNQIDGSENHIIRIPKELPNFTIPYGTSQDKESDNPFETTDRESEGDTDSTDPKCLTYFQLATINVTQQILFDCLNLLSAA